MNFEKIENIALAIIQISIAALLAAGAVYAWLSVWEKIPY